MPITRRDFLKLSGITASGTLLGGVSLLSGCKAKPDKLKGSRVTTTICPFCATGCGMLVSSLNETVINIEGDPDHPINRGALCAKGMALYQAANNPGKKRLKKVRYRKPGGSEWETLSWDKALEMIASRIKDARDKTFIEKQGTAIVNRTTGIVGLGGATLNNEESYLFSRFARHLGITSLENQARLSHSSTVAGLSNTFGRGAMTNHWIDIQHSNVVLIIGSNTAENHPIAFSWVQKAIDKGAQLIHVDPRFTRTSARADIYAPIRPGTDIAFMNGIINYALEKERVHREYIITHTNAPLLVNQEFGFSDGLFTGYDVKGRTYDAGSWNYQLSAKGLPMRDTSLSHQNCVYQLMKRHFSRYTPEMVSAVTGCPMKTFIKIAELFTGSFKPERAATILYSSGATQHSVGTQNVRTFSMLQLLLGNIGMAGGGINALQSESNAQGSTDHGILWDLLPGYLDIPMAGRDNTLKAYIRNTVSKTNDPRSTNWWRNKPKYLVSLLKAWFGDNAGSENNFGYDWLPKADRDYSHLSIFDNMRTGKYRGALILGQNPAVSGPNSDRETRALERLDWLVCGDLFENETAAFWKRPGKNPASVKTEIFLLPTAASFEKEGSVVNSGRWAQWRYKAVSPPGDARDELWIIDSLFKEIQRLYKAAVAIGSSVANPDPIIKAHWNFNLKGLEHPVPEQVAREINGFDWKTGKQINDFNGLRADGSTACGNWLYSGSYTEMGNMMARREQEDTSGGLGLHPEWAWCWPANTRILYNRASVNERGEPWNPDKAVIQWNGNTWEGDVPDGTGRPERVRAFIMVPEGVGRLFASGLEDGPFPEHYEPLEGPTANIMGRQKTNPVAPSPDSIKNELGTAGKYPYVATTFKVAEHWQTGTLSRNLPWLTELVPGVFCEISPELAKKKGILNGDIVEVTSARGSVQTRALVTGRIKAFSIKRRKIEMIGLVWHFGYECAARGDSANSLTIHHGDPNSMIPEYKAFLVDIKKV